MAAYHPWTPQEWRFLLKNKGVSFYEMHRRMVEAGFDRKLGGVRRMMDRMGLSKRRSNWHKWERYELLILQELYPRANYADLLKSLPGRSKESIYSKATYLGLHRPSRVLLTPEQIREKKRIYEGKRRRKHINGGTHIVDRRIQT